MSISATDVKKLRDMTGAGMMDAKKALTETNSDFEAAVKYLREKGLADSKKREDKEANRLIRCQHRLTKCSFNIRNNFSRPHSSA